MNPGPRSCAPLPRRRQSSASRAAVRSSAWSSGRRPRTRRPSISRWSRSGSGWRSALTSCGRNRRHRGLHCTRKDLDEALAANHYDLVYYTGHGTFADGVGYLCLEKSDGGTDLLPATDFARKLALQGSPPALVFLNCCLAPRPGRAGRCRGFPGRRPAPPARRRALCDRDLDAGLRCYLADLHEAFLRHLLRSDRPDQRGPWPRPERPCSRPTRTARASPRPSSSTCY